MWVHSLPLCVHSTGKRTFHVWFVPLSRVLSERGGQVRAHFPNSGCYRGLTWSNIISRDFKLLGDCPPTKELRGPLHICMYQAKTEKRGRFRILISSFESRSYLSFCVRPIALVLFILKHFQERSQNFSRGTHNFPNLSSPLSLYNIT